MISIKNFSLVAIIVTIILTSNVENAAALTCYDSTSSSGTSTGCVACQKTVASALGSTSITKSCDMTACEALNANLGSLGGAAVYCCSNVDLCNGYSHVMVSLPGVLMTSLFAFWLTRQLL